GDGSSFSYLSLMDAADHGWHINFSESSLGDLLFVVDDAGTITVPFKLADTGEVAIGLVGAAQTILDVNGTIKMAYSGEACDAAREGSIHYNSSDNSFYVCRTAGSWDMLATGT